MLKRVESHLSSRWGLKIKPSSREVLIPRESHKAEGWSHDSWPVRSSMRVLGHIVSDDGSWRPCWEATRRALWQGFFACVRPRGGPRLSKKARVTLIQKTVAPRLDFRLPKWPAVKQLHSELDATQRRMYGLCIDIPRAPGESAECFHRRRGRVGASLAVAAGLWSERHKRRAKEWLSHLRRARGSQAWAAKVLPFRDTNWIREQRARLGPLLAGRTATRRASGHVHSRWEESLVRAGAPL